MDELIAVGLAMTAAVAWTALIVLDHLARGSEFGGAGRLMAYALLAVSYGTLLVSTMGILDVQGGLVALLVAFNRAVLAGLGLYLLPGPGAGSVPVLVSSERGRRLRGKHWERTVPGWVLVGVVVFLVVTREPSETLVGTLLGFAAVFIGVPLALPGKPKP